MNVDIRKYYTDRGDGDYAFLFEELYDIQGSKLEPSTILSGNYSIGEISNLTGDLAGKNVYIGTNNALYPNGDYEIGDRGTFDLELTNPAGNTITVRFVINIIQ